MDDENVTLSEFLFCCSGRVRFFLPVSTPSVSTLESDDLDCRWSHTIDVVLIFAL